ncbi:MAG: hypothetical protein IT429_00965 [Gemmataceae bacterium]|nr:hypothetical protein [Gemmataceae bacterium]
MSRFARTVLLASLGALALTAPTQAFERWVGTTSSYYYTASYYPSVSYYTPGSYYTPVTYSAFYTAPVWEVSYAVPVTYCAPASTVVVPAAASVYAQPTAAPPSQTVEPPPSASTPKVTESRGGNRGSVTARTGLGPDRAQVGFWNVAGRDLNLTVDGQSYILGRGRSLTLNLGRQFAWRVDGGAAHAERVPAGTNTLEIVVRQ